MQLLTEFPDGSYRAHNAVVTADVTLGKLSSLWFNVVVRGDVAPVRIGQRVNVQDGAMIHCDSGIENIVEDDVSIGHGAILHGHSVGRGSLIGIRAVLLGRTRIGAECIVAAGAIVPPGLEVPDRMMVMGVPGRIVRPVNEQELAYLRRVSATYIELAQKYANGTPGNT